MPISGSMACCRGETFEVTFQMSPEEDITGDTMIFECRTGSFGGTVISTLTKELGDADFEVVDASTGECLITLSASDTNRTPGVLFCTVSRTNSGREAVLAEITWTIRSPRVGSV